MSASEPTEVPGATQFTPEQYARLAHAIDQSAPGDPYAPTAWQYDQDHTCPSGQRCRIRKLGLKEMISAGFMDTLNTLQGVVDKGIRKGSGQPPIEIDPVKLMADKRTANQFAELLDAVCLMVVTAPQLWAVPKDDEPRVVGRVYVDSVSITDKIDIFETALGEVKDLESFRKQSEQPAERLADEPGDALPSQ